MSDEKKTGAQVAADRIDYVADQIVNAFSRAKKESQRAIRAQMKSMPYDKVASIPTGEMRLVVEAIFRAFRRVLDAERKLAVGVIDALELPKHLAPKPEEKEIVREEVAKIAAVS